MPVARTVANPQPRTAQGQGQWGEETKKAITREPFFLTEDVLL